MAQPRATESATRPPSPDAKGKKWIRVRQVRSGIGFKFNQRRVLEGLGLRRPGRSVVLEDTPSTRGMCDKISHLVVFEEVAGPNGEGK